MRVVTQIVVGLALSFLVVGCGPRAAPPAVEGTGGSGPTGGAGATDDPASIYTATPLRADDRPCSTADECADGEQCQSPEQSSWNFCGAPREPACPEDWVGDSCGHCFPDCAADADCPAGTTCNGSFCMSPARCVAPRIAPP